MYGIIGMHYHLSQKPESKSEIMPSQTIVLLRHNGLPTVSDILLVLVHASLVKSRSSVVLICASGAVGTRESAKLLSRN